MKGNKQVLLAAALGGIMMAGNAAADNSKTAAPSKGTPVMCHGVNGCKGQGTCHGKVSGCSGAQGCEMSISCAGKNECKDKGLIKMSSEKECKDKGGKVAKS